MDFPQQMSSKVYAFYRLQAISTILFQQPAIWVSNVKARLSETVRQVKHGDVPSERRRGPPLYGV